MHLSKNGSGTKARFTGLTYKLIILMSALLDQHRKNGRNRDLYQDLLRRAALELRHVQLVVAPAFRQQFFMCTGFDDMALIHHHDLVRIADG